VPVNTEEGERPRPGGAELRHHRQPRYEELAGQNLEAPVRRTSRRNAQGPERSTVAILRALGIQPATVEAHVIVEAARDRIERMVQESRVRGAQGPHAIRFRLQLVEKNREDEGPRVIVGAVAFRKIRYGENGVLEHSSRVG